MFLDDVSIWVNMSSQIFLTKIMWRHLMEMKFWCIDAVKIDTFMLYSQEE